ncbi:hypothetical protein AOC05_05730 [Arthrobacter alpinus]|uniref:HTH luxR-type domain-containing protein n=1 Tax=Arthrobacter alpinus TaxID=656366 RepID=A0A0M5LX72_9MICC|nr:LuxR C-terminal-related transcriptional regulator [Arthrobacter alpinus]ALE91950.1 hypothetical protein AOC05_05730 [Arthrobacter alpinus]
MAREVVASKLRRPRLRPGLITRPRLNALMRSGTELRLMLVSAPAEFGKTTLMAEWLEHAAGHGGRIAWLSLDASDSEPEAFWGAVVAALQTVLPGIGSTAAELLQAFPFPTELALTAVLNGLTADPHELWLVLDDYHAADGYEVGRGMAFLLEHLPPQVHVVISTRADPLLPLPRWRVRGELAEIRAAELRFTPSEVSTYLNDVAGQDLAPAQIAVLEQRTEGWIAALQMAALSLQGRTDPAAFIARFAGDDSFILDYLVEEVLVCQPQPVRDFLLETAVLERFTGALCDAVTGRAGGSGMLLALERANLFLVPLDGHREWHRYHQLFADVLRARLLNERPGLVPLLHQRASHWFQDRELMDEAVRHAVSAQDFGRAAHLMELAVPAIRRNRQDSVMRDWLKLLPESAIRSSPVLGVFDAYMLMSTGELDGVEPRLQEAERVMAAAPPGPASPWAGIEEFATIPATIAIYRASLAQARGDVAGTAAHARQALELAGSADHLARGAANGFLGLAAWVDGDVHAALQTFGRAVADLHAAGNLVDAFGSTALLADMWLAAGRPVTARRLLEDTLARAGELGGSVARATAELHVGLGEIDCEAGELDAAARHLAAAGDFYERAPTVESSYRWFVARALLASASGDEGLALDFLNQAGPLYHRGFFPEVRPLAAMKARIWIRQGELPQAAAWARSRGLLAAGDANHLYECEYDALTLVRLLLALHRAGLDRAGLHRAGLARTVAGTGSTAQLHLQPAKPLDPSVETLLERLLQTAEASGRAGSTVEIRLLAALVHDAQGHQGLARESFASALAEAAESEGRVRLFLDEGTPMQALLREASHASGPGHTSRRASRLLSLAHSQGNAAHPGHGPASDTQTMATGSLGTAKPAGTETLSTRELHVLRLLGGGLSGPAIAGELFISYNTLRTHTKHIFTKLGVNDRRAAVRTARERGLL